MNRTLPASIAAVALLAVSLSGCTPQSLSDLNKYADLIAEQPGVQSIDVATSTPLPFVVQGTLITTLEPTITREQFEAIHAVACDTEVNASVYFSLQVEFSSGALLDQTSLPKCWTDPVQFIEALPAIERHSALFEVIDWMERTPEQANGQSTPVTTVRFDLSPTGKDAAVGALATAGREVLESIPAPDGLYSWDLGEVDVTAATAELTTRVLVASEDVAQGHPLLHVAFDEELVLQLDTIDPAAVADTTAYLTTTYPDLPVRAVLDSTINLPQGIPSADALALAALIVESGLTDYIWADDFGIGVTTRDTADNALVAQLALDAGLTEPSIDYTTHPEEQITIRVSSRSEDQATIAELEDVDALTTALLPTGRLGRIDAQDDEIDFSVSKDLEGDSSAIAAFTDDVRLALGSVGTTWRTVSVEGRELD